MRGSAGRLVTWIVVVAVAALAAAAALDAVRDRETPEAESDLTRERAPRLQGVAAELAAAGVQGALSYVDDECRAHTIRLPAVTPVDVPPTVPCRIATPLRPSAAFFAHPRGTLGAVREAVTPSLALTSPRDVAVHKLAWLDESRVAAIVSSRNDHRRTRIAVVDGDGLVGSAPWLPSRSARFFVSPRGSFFAVATNGPSHFFLLDRDARPGVLPDIARDWFGRTSLTGARAIAWSPDERWTALAKNESVYVFTTDDSNPKLVRLPIDARDLAWD